MTGQNDITPKSTEALDEAVRQWFELTLQVIEWRKSQLSPAVTPDGFSPKNKLNERGSNE
jgi:hypothetical protein